MKLTLTLNMMKKNKMKNLIGRKVKGFKFEGIDGEIGIIECYNEFNNSYDIIFPKFIWRCPAEEIENYLYNK